MTIAAIVIRCIVRRATKPKVAYALMYCLHQRVLAHKGKHKEEVFGATVVRVDFVFIVFHNLVDFGIDEVLVGRIRIHGLATENGEWFRV